MNAKEWAALGADLSAATRAYVERKCGELLDGQRGQAIRIELLEAELRNVREQVRALEAEKPVGVRR